MLSELFKELLERSDFENQTTLANATFESKDRKHIDFLNKQFGAKSTTMERLNKIFKTLVGDVSVSEIADSIEFTKKIKKGVKSDFL
jgi:hypothetical protein